MSTTEDGSFLEQSMGGVDLLPMPQGSTITDIDREIRIKQMERRLKSLTTRLRRRKQDAQELETQLASAHDELREARTEIQNLTNDLRSAGNKLSRSMHREEKLQWRVNRLRTRRTNLQAFVKAQNALSVQNAVIRDWLCQDRTARLLGLGSSVATAGTGPYDAAEFDRFLDEHKFRVRDIPHSDTGILIVGRKGWDEEQIYEQITAREGVDLRVFSQELFILALACAQDPFTTAEQDLLRDIGKRHPALAMLMKSRFEWPTYTAGGDEQEFRIDEDAWSEISPLKEMGYTVGITYGLPVVERHELLHQAFTKPLPWVTSHKYMASWGAPHTPRRLWRIAHHLWVQAKMHHLQEYAVKDWKADSNWLKKEFYGPAMRFKWPQIKID